MQTEINPIAIINASPLILLSQIGAIKLLKRMYSQIKTTKFVKNEVLRKENAIEIPILNQIFQEEIEIEHPKKSQIEEIIANFSIHEGEASIIVLANEYLKKKAESVVIIDDLAAREIAKTFGLTVTGTIGVILKAVKGEIITKKDGKNYIQKLVNNTSFYIDGQLLLNILNELE